MLYLLGLVVIDIFKFMVRYKLKNRVVLYINTYYYYQHSVNIFTSPTDKWIKSFTELSYVYWSYITN